MELNQSLIQFKMSGSTKTKLLIGMVLGIAGLALAFVGGATEGWRNLIVITFLFTTFALFGTFITSIFYITGTEWGIVVRRLTESLGKQVTVALAFIIAVAAAFFIDPNSMMHVYSWLDPKVLEYDAIIAGKEAYLNKGGFVGRLLIFGLVWWFFANMFYKHSVAQDTDGDINHTLKLSRVSALFIIIFALTYSFFGIDLLMSASPHWFSTMFGVYCFAGLAFSGFALTIIFVNYLKKNGMYGEYLNENHIHDLGKFMWGFSIFYTYIAFSQFMLIWYASIPIETGFYEDRVNDGVVANTVLIAMVMTRFFIPFFLLVKREWKRDIKYLTKIAWVVIVSQILDIVWLMYFGTHGGGDHHAPAAIVVGSLVLSLIGMGSLLAFGTLKTLEKQALVPVKDPRLEESLHWHQ